MNSELNFGEKAENALIIGKRLFLFIVILALLFTAGCGQGDEKKFNLGYKIYIPNMSDSSITVVPEKDSDEPDTIDLERNPAFIKALPGKDKIYVLLEGTNDIAIVDMEEDEVEEIFKFEVGSAAGNVNYRIKFDDDGKKGYVATSYGAAGIAVMDVSDNSFEEGINVESTSVDRMFFSGTGSRLYATDPTSQKIYSINTTTNDLVETIDVPEEYTTSYFKSSTSEFYMAESGNNAAVKLYNLSSDTFTDRVDETVSKISRLITSPDMTKLYVVGSTQYAIIDLSDFTLDEIIDFDYRDPTDFRWLPDKSFILAPSGANDLLMVINEDDHETEETIDTGDNPGEIVVRIK